MHPRSSAMGKGAAKVMKQNSRHGSRNQLATWTARAHWYCDNEMGFVTLYPILIFTTGVVFVLQVLIIRAEPNLTLSWIIPCLPKMPMVGYFSWKFYQLCKAQGDLLKWATRAWRKLHQKKLRQSVVKQRHPDESNDQLKHRLAELEEEYHTDEELLAELTEEQNKNMLEKLLACELPEMGSESAPRFDLHWDSDQIDLYKVFKKNF